MHERGSRTSDYDFDLPESLIAQRAVEPRDASRLMVVHRDTGAIEHRHFRDLPGYTAPGDLLVVNATRVFRARLLGTRPSGGRAEVMLLEPQGDHRWEAMVSPGAKLRPGRHVHVADGFDVEIESTTGAGTRIVRLVLSDAFRDDMDAIAQHGHVPLPPYIARADEPVDVERYQTVYAREEGSVAAPTAGLHFTPGLLDRLTTAGVQRAEVVLHVGAGTFKPVDVEDPAEHAMHEEWYSISPETATAITETRAHGGRVIAVGTTTVRTLEAAAAESGVVAPGDARTRIFIRPPYRFRAIDRLVTNFHLPRSTLLMLVAAFAGYDLTMRAYREAVAEGYRFYSYGDAMLIL